MQTPLTTLTQVQVDKMLQEHLHWLNKDCRDWINKRANFSNCNLEYVDFSNQHCQGAIFNDTYIENAQFNSTILINASFKNAIIKRSNFSNAMLSDTSFENAVLVRTDFSRAMLIGSMFCNADIRTTSFIKSILTAAVFTNATCSTVDFRYSLCTNANFKQANIIKTNFEHANIHNAYFDEKESARYGRILKEPLIGYKKTFENVVITAEIPVGAIVFSINNSKCRANKAKIIDMNGYTLLHARFNPDYRYTLGQQIEIVDFDMSYNVECGAGFHFFKTYDEAIAYH